MRKKYYLDINKMTDISIHHDTPFEVNDDTSIGFGKLKGKPHSVLLSKDNKEYSKWIIDQGEEFRYSSTREYILDNNNRSKDYDLEKAIKLVLANKDHQLVSDLKGEFLR